MVQGVNSMEKKIYPLHSKISILLMLGWRNAFNSSNFSEIFAL